MDEHRNVEVAVREHFCNMPEVHPSVVPAAGVLGLRSLAKRKRNPLEQTTINTRRYALDKWIYPFFEGRLLADVNNLAMRDFVEHISELAPATIRDYSNIVKAVVASAINEKGDELFPQTWNEEFIDAPLVKLETEGFVYHGSGGACEPDPANALV